MPLRGELNNIRIEGNTIINNLSKRDITTIRNTIPDDLNTSINDTTVFINANDAVSGNNTVASDADHIPNGVRRFSTVQRRHELEQGLEADPAIQRRH